LVCLDTTFLIDWLRGSERARKKYDELRSHAEESSQLATSIITVYELHKGANLSKNPIRDLKIVHDLLSELVILELDMSAVDLSSEIYSDLSRSGKLVGEFDILIAATCIITGQSLITNDRDFDQIAKLSKIHY
jgi:tRNA(fMet)-specific endonuclease VapC